MYWILVIFLLGPAYAQNCGVSLLSDLNVERIVGGQPATKDAWPWQVSLRKIQGAQSRHFCGAALISDRWIATAAHCVVDNHGRIISPAGTIHVRVGEHDQNQREHTEIQVQAKQIFKYPSYSGYNNDIALIKLTKRVQLSKSVQPICLPSPNQDFTNLQCVSTGWGATTSGGGAPSSLLRQVKVPVYANNVCAGPYLRKFRIEIKEFHLCAGALEGGRGSCYGDSGGPFQCKVGNQWYLAGLVSFGSGCAHRDYPDVYSRVTHFLSWIQQTIAENGGGTVVG